LYQSAQLLVHGRDERTHPGDISCAGRAALAAKIEVDSRELALGGGRIEGGKRLDLLEDVVVGQGHVQGIRRGAYTL
jgi:hypothetical protein